MQVVFVHGVNTRDLGDGDYENWVAARNDRLSRLAFSGQAEIHNPYWGKFGHQGKTLKSIPRPQHQAQPFAHEAASSRIVDLAKSDFAAAVASLSVHAISHATIHEPDDTRHEIEDFWLVAADLADEAPPPQWLSTIKSDDELFAYLDREVTRRRALDSASRFQPMAAGWKPSLPRFDGNAFLAEKARDLAAAYLAQFLGDALMFFSRREQSILVRKEVCESIISAAKAATERKQPLILIGYSMGGGILHEMLTDPDTVAQIEGQLGHPLEVDLFLSVGTQIGMFAELKQFVEPPGDRALAVAVRNYWNVFDFNDTLAFLCQPVLKGVVDMEVNTSANVAGAHGSYFESALFFRRLNARLMDAGLI